MHTGQDFSANWFVPVGLHLNSFCTMDDLKKRKAESGTGVAVDGVNKRPKVQMFGTGGSNPWDSPSGIDKGNQAVSNH